MDDDNDVERDDALEYIIYQDVMGEDQDQGQTPRGGGCLSMLVLLVLLSTSALLLI